MLINSTVFVLQMNKLFPQSRLPSISLVQVIFSRGSLSGYHFLLHQFFLFFKVELSDFTFD